MSTLFGKPKGSVIKHPGIFRKAAAKAGESTAAYAQEKKHASGKVGARARLALTLMKMRKKKGK
jgi:hypothetical protein